MESRTTDSKDQMPIKSEDDDDLEETLAERLWGLSEMFPEEVRNATCRSWWGLKGMFGFTKKLTWAIFTSGVILVAPIYVEIARVEMAEEIERNQQYQMKRALITNYAISGASGLGMVPRR